MSMRNICSEYSQSTLTNVMPGDPQPNACDLRLDKVFRVNTGTFKLSEETKKHRGSQLIAPDRYGWYLLRPGHYEVTMMNMITVGPDEAGFVITRSTLNRNGVFLTSGLYDSGYNGIMAAMMHVNIGDLCIKQGTRIGQYLSFDAESISQYDGSYGFTKAGIAKSDEEKYHG